MTPAGLVEPFRMARAGEAPAQASNTGCGVGAENCVTVALARGHSQPE